MSQAVLFRVSAIILLVLLVSKIFSDPSQRDHPLERTICGLKEPIYFWLWSKAAGSPKPERLKRISNIEDIAITSEDGRTLWGYKLRAEISRKAEKPPTGYLLVAQGNAMLADQIMDRFQTVADAGYDLYVFDFRGYGRSEGKRRLKAMLSDYRRIVEHLDAMNYKSRAFYGMSFGGILLLDALRDRWGNAIIIIDSTPSRLSDHGCPEAHDPVNNLPASAGNLVVIVGARDRVVTPFMSRELVDRAEASGATVFRDPEFGHPFMDSHTDRRMAMIRASLMEGNKNRDGWH